MIILNSEIGEKLDQCFDVKFDEESEFDRFEAEGASRDVSMTSYSRDRYF